MSQKIEGLWLGGEISREAAEIVQRAVERAVDDMARMLIHDKKTRTELHDLANAIRAQIQALPPPPKPVCDLV